MERLIPIREGHKKVIQHYFRRIEAAKEDPTPTTFNTILENIRLKLKDVKDIDQKIIEVIQPSDIETEIVEAEEYTLNTEIEISSLEDFRKSRGYTDREVYSQFSEPAIQLIPGLQTSQQTVSSTFSQSHKLPKLSLPTFSGDLLQWQTFWDSYESSIHNNPSLTDVQKFTYLKAQIDGIAANTIAGFGLTNANYSRAIDLLHERFGQTHKIVQAYMHALLQLPAPNNTLNSLQKYYDQLESYIRGLESLGQHQETYGSLLVPVVIGKLPAEIRKNLAREHRSDSWILADLRRAIHQEITIIDAGQTTVIPEVHESTALFFTGTKQKSIKTNDKRTDMFKPDATKVCVFCNDNHSSNNCNNVTAYESRIEIVKKKHLCFNCLGNHQVSKCRSSYRCRNCKRKHHTSICEGNSHQSTKSSRQTDQSDMAILHSATQSKPNVLLKTAIVEVSYNKCSTNANILFDEGAQRSFITEKLANELQLPRGNTETIHLTSFGDSNQSVRHLNTGTVYLVTDAGYKIPIEVLIIPNIAVALQNLQRSVINLPYLRGLKLAHPLTNQDSFEISLLIGADFYWKIVQNRIIRGNGPTAVSSKIGYLLSGPLPMTSSTKTTSHILNVLTSPPDVNQLEKFWKLESIGIMPEEDSSNSNYLQQYQEKCITFKDGRYSAMLPWKRDYPTLPTNYNIAKCRTLNTIRRLKLQPEMLQNYGEIIHEQESRGFIEKVHNTDTPSHNTHYIPHHAVKKESTTTPIRIVYDCSCRQSCDHPSLNDCLESTPPILNDLTSILVRFRLHKYAVSTDIEKAFLHVQLEEKDRDFTRFLWLSDPDDANSLLTTYRFKSVLFGATCSPFILSATILKHLREHKNNWVSDILKRDLYVDNILSSFSTESDVIDFFRCTRHMMSDAGFNLRSWASNNQVLRSFAENENVLDTDKVTKVLGMQWNTETDELSFTNRPIPVTAYTTKREILQQTSRLYDPLGILSPVTIRAKIMLQDLWQQKYTWDTKLPEDLHHRWSTLVRDLNLTMKTKIRRHISSCTSLAVDNCTSADDMNTLHIFVDASLQSYGAVAYLCGKHISTFVMAKSRVAPLKTLTLPRLELMAAVIGSRLARYLQRACSIDEENTNMWSDSQIVLYWLQTSKPKKRFVENRVHEIQKLTSIRNWRYCPTNENPADLLTRGISAKQYNCNDVWMSGPTWICDHSQWPIWTPQYNTVLTMTTVTNESLDYNSKSISSEKAYLYGLHNMIDVSKFSTYRKLLRVTAYVLRFVNKCRSKTSFKVPVPLTVTELQNAERLWLKNCQITTYSDEIVNMKSNRNRLPLVKQLRLFIDKEEYIRCGGRIHNAPLCETTKFPYLLPAKHQITRLIILDAHERQLHAGVSAMITYLRQKYWIPSIRQVVRGILRKCVICRKVEGRPYDAPDPPPLPSYRVDDAPPFSVTGVDFTGALYV